jgi:hypothetical protein
MDDSSDFVRAARTGLAALFGEEGYQKTSAMEWKHENFHQWMPD